MMDKFLLAVVCSLVYALSEAVDISDDIEGGEPLKKCCPKDEAYIIRGKDAVSVTTKTEVDFAFYACEDKYAFVKGNTRWLYTDNTVYEITLLPLSLGAEIIYECAEVAGSTDELNEGNLHLFHQCLPGCYAQVGIRKYLGTDVGGRTEKRTVTLQTEDPMQCVPKGSSYSIEGTKYSHQYDYRTYETEVTCDDQVFQLPPGVTCTPLPIYPHNGGICTVTQASDFVIKYGTC